MDVLILHVLRLLAVICTVSLLIIAAEGLRIAFSRRILAKRLHRGRGALISLVTAERMTPEDQATLRELPPADQDQLLIALARSLDGMALGRLRDLARGIGALERARELTRSRFWWRRLRGAQMLTALGVKAEAMLPLLNDRNPTVRGQAIHWAGDHPSAQVIDRLLAMLRRPGDPSRFAILNSITRMGDAAATSLSRVLRSSAGGCLDGVLQVATVQPHPAYAPAAVALCAHDRPEVRAQSAELLAVIGGPPEFGVIDRLLADDDAGVRAAAARAVGLMGHEAAAERVAAMLRDSAWHVRHNAATALGALGDAGHGLLQRATADQDAFAADMARQILDVMQAGDAG